jgi:2-(1,2-epoxy-1,2-dihydrophenyl)acetyl-CoA isomerase
MFLAEKLPAAEAAAMGLVNRVVPAGELDAAVDQLVDKLTALPTGALALTKRLVNASLEHDRSASFLQEASFQELQSHSDDAKEGVASFLERRPAEFKGY